MEDPRTPRSFGGARTGLRRTVLPRTFVAFTLWGLFPKMARTSFPAIAERLLSTQGPGPKSYVLYVMGHGASVSHPKLDGF